MSVQSGIEAGKYRNRIKIDASAPIDTYREQRATYRVMEDQITARLKADLEAEHCVVAHPKADKLFKMAWQLGHSSGHEEVVNWYEELVEFLK